jgi:gamma-glutamyltranspeptidase / glutathione hydrolase
MLPALLFVLASPSADAPLRKSANLRTGVVVSDERLASEVGAEILRKGGNAVDAAVATAFALAVVEPAAGNIGGGGFMLVRMADGRTVFIDYRETAPLAGSRDMYLDAEGKPTQDSLIGYRAAGVPGTVAGMREAMRRYGTMSWRQVIEPAYRLARDGFRLSESLAKGLAAQVKLFSQFPESSRIFNRSGNPYVPGETFKQPELAATLARIRDKGPDDFYRGQTATLLAADMKANGGLITLADLHRYRVKVRKPLLGTYRGYQVLTAPPPSSGGTALLEMLNVLEGTNLRESGSGTAETTHLMAETMRRAFADRSKFMGDPDFVKVPVEKLTSKTYAKQLLAGINRSQATPSSSIVAGEPGSGERLETTHFSVVDRFGNAVANTYTLNGGFGSGATVKGAGFLLNNEMDDFTAKPGSPNLFGLIQGAANAIQPGKRPLSSMTPTIVLRDGKLYLVVGSPGGPTIINTTLHVIVNVVDHGMGIQSAVDAPRFHHQWLPDEISVESAVRREVTDGLEAKGHKVKRIRSIGIANCIRVDPKTGVSEGAPDKRHANATAAGG